MRVGRLFSQYERGSKAATRASSAFLVDGEPGCVSEVEMSGKGEGTVEVGLI